MSDLEPIREQWITERPIYEALARGVERELKCRLQQRGLVGICSARAKDVASLVKKVLRKGYGYDDIHDKAGVRVIVDLPAEVGIVEEIVRQCFDVRHYENKSSALIYNQLAYLGVHFEILIKDGVAAAHPDWCEKLCEVQIHTRAQNCWADISHRLTYKPDEERPGEIMRRVYRLMALVELFDENIEMARQELLQLPGFEEGRLLNELENWFYRLTARPFDRELSLEIIGKLQESYEASEREGFKEILRAFAEANLQKLETIYEDYRDDDRCSPLLFQPEALMVFERLERDEFRLKEVWSLKLPETLLHDLAVIWGRSI